MKKAKTASKAKKTAKPARTAAKKSTKAAAKKSTRYSLLNELHEAVMSIATTAKNGEVKIKRADLKNVLEETFNNGVKMAASGQRVRFPVIGSLARREVKARKSGKGLNPFTGEEIMIKARPESKKPRWSFPKNMKEAFANKRNW